MRRGLTDQEVWERVKEIIVNQRVIPERLYAYPLTKLGSLVFGTPDPNYLKPLNHQLAHVLKKHGIKVIKRSYVRYALIPESLLKRLEAKERRKEEMEPLVLP